MPFDQPSYVLGDGAHRRHCRDVPDPREAGLLGGPQNPREHVVLTNGQRAGPGATAREANGNARHLVHRRMLAHVITVVEASGGSMRKRSSARGAGTVDERHWAPYPTN